MLNQDELSTLLYYQIPKFNSVFKSFVENNYDLREKLINEKYEHGLRVASLSFNLAIRLHLDYDDVLLAYKIGLLHDVGRFEEAKKRKKFNNLTFDHAACSNKIVFNDGIGEFFTLPKEESLLIKKAIYYHNKKELGDDLNERESLFAKIIRDVDKIDIINVRTINYHMHFFSEPSEKVLDNFYNNEEIDLKDLKVDSDWIILYFGFLHNLNFEESKEILMDKGYLDKFIKSIVVSDDQSELFCKLVDLINKKERGKEYVR